MESGAVLGLGTGSTVAHLLEILARRIGSGLRIRCVPSSLRTEAECLRLGIPLMVVDSTFEIDLCIDGADEVDPSLDCLKGLGGAFVREKVLAAAARRFIIIADESKIVPRLGTRSPVLVEAIPFAVPFIFRLLKDLVPRHRLRDGQRVVSDNGNEVIELQTGPLEDPLSLARRLESTPGIAGHGLFLGLAHSAYVASAEGVRKLER